MKSTSLVLATALFSALATAQSTCFTNPHGTTICSTPGAVIHGHTNSVGNSVYRDDRGQQLDFKTDQFGNAQLRPQPGDPVQWSQPVLGEKRYPEWERREGAAVGSDNGRGSSIPAPTAGPTAIPSGAQAAQPPVPDKR